MEEDGSWTRVKGMGASRDERRAGNILANKRKVSLNLRPKSLSAVAPFLHVEQMRLCT